MHRQKGTSNIPDKGVRTKSWTRKGPLQEVVNIAHV